MGMTIDLMESVVIIYVGLYLQFISQNWVYIQIFGSCLLLAGVLFTFMFNPETPRYLFAKGKKVEGYKNLRRMARINGSTERLENHITKHSINT